MVPTLDVLLEMSMMAQCMRDPIHHFTTSPPRPNTNTCLVVTAKATDPIDHLPLRMSQRMFNNSRRWQWTHRINMKCTCRHLSSRLPMPQEQVSLLSARKRSGAYHPYLEEETSRRRVLLNRQTTFFPRHPSRGLNRVNRHQNACRRPLKLRYLRSVMIRKRRKRKLRRGLKSWKWLNEKLRLELRRNELEPLCRNGTNSLGIDHKARPGPRLNLGWEITSILGQSQVHTELLDQQLNQLLHYTTDMLRLQVRD